MSLLALKPTLQTEIFAAVQDAALQAHMTLIAPTSDDPGINASVQTQAMTAGQTYAVKMAEVLSPKLTEAIYNFVKGIQIMLIPQTLISSAPGSPVTGSADTENIGGILVL